MKNNQDVRVCLKMGYTPRCGNFWNGNMMTIHWLLILSARFSDEHMFSDIHSSRGRTSRSNHCQSTVSLMVRNLPQFLRITRLVTDHYSTPMYTPNLKTSRFLLPEKGAELTILTLACNHHAEHQVKVPCFGWSSFPKSKIQGLTRGSPRWCPCESRAISDGGGKPP